MFATLPADRTLSTVSQYIQDMQDCRLHRHRHSRGPYYATLSSQIPFVLQRLDVASWLLCKELLTVDKSAYLLFIRYNFRVSNIMYFFKS